MNSGFKGVRLGLRSLTLKESVIAYEVAFLSDDGVLHGIMQHSLLSGGNEEIDQKVQELATLLLNRAAALHFTSPGSRTDSGGLLTQGASHGGIAEALEHSGSSLDEPGGPEDAGGS